MAELQADGVLEEAEGNIRQQLMAAAQLDAQRVAARAELAPVHNASLWEQAQVRDVARAYETAVTFRDEDQAARDAESRIRHELRDRYDVEVLETGADPAVVRATIVDRDTERAERDERQAQARNDQDFAAGLVVGPEVLEVSADLADAEEAQDLRDLAAGVEAAVEHDTELSLDSVERRELHVEGIKAGPDQAAAATAWKQADVDQARHPREAVQGGRKGKSSRNRVPASTPDRQIGRDGR